LRRGARTGKSQEEKNAPHGKIADADAVSAEISNLSERFNNEPAPDSYHDRANFSESYQASGLDSCSASGICFDADLTQRSKATTPFQGQAAAHISPRNLANEEMFSSHEERQRFQAVLVIQMELCTGPTLRSWLDSRLRKRLWEHGGEHPWFVRGSKGDALELVFAKHLMKGIREIHATDMVHRDVKPQNLFVTHDEVLKIGDFGLSRSANDKVDGLQVGTPAYCAPEGGARAGAPADVFSAALVILELLCPPFGTTMERAKVLSDFRERRVVPEHVCNALPEHAELLRRMASFSPEERPTAEDVHADLKRLGTGRVLASIHEGTLEPHDS